MEEDYRGLPHWVATPRLMPPHHLAPSFPQLPDPPTHRGAVKIRLR
jgi:hypothetical protein